MSVAFTEENLIGSAGLVPAVGLATQIGLVGLGQEHVKLSGPGRANAGVKLMSIVAGDTPSIGTPSTDRTARKTTQALPTRQLAMGEKLAQALGQDNDSRHALNPKPHVPNRSPKHQPKQSATPACPKTANPPRQPKPRSTRPAAYRLGALRLERSF